jgi:hypothetical protein
MPAFKAAVQDGAEMSEMEGGASIRRAFKIGGIGMNMLEDSDTHVHFCVNMRPSSNC